MKNIKGFICLILVSIMCLMCCAGCKQGDGEDTQGGSDSKDTTQTVKLSLAEYTIIHTENPDYNSDATLAFELVNLLSQKGITMEIKSDYLADGESYDDDAKEILIGRTGYEQSQKALEQIGESEYLIKRDGNKIVIIGGSKRPLDECINYFVESCIAVENGELFFTGDEEYKGICKLEEGATRIRIVSLNLLKATSPAQNNQSNREPRIVSFIKSAMPTSLGVQECESFWKLRLDYVLGNLGYASAHEEVYSESKDYAYKNFIYYNTETTELVESGQMWLSETPDVPSCGFGQGFYISAGWAILRDKNTGMEYVHINTHMTSSTDEEDKELYRRPMSEMLAAKVQEFQEKGYKVFVTGDFNSKENTDVYKNMTEVLLDSRYTAEVSTKMGTYNGCSNDDMYRDPSNYAFPDYIFHTDSEDIYVEKFRVIDKWNGGYLSDHNAVVVDATLYERK